MRKFFISLVFLSFSKEIISLEPAATDTPCPWIQNYLTPVPDFPKPGIVFQWYANLLKDPEAFHVTIETLAKRYEDRLPDAIVGLDARGFIFGAALAYELKVPFVMVRKPGKLPRDVERTDYSLEYGKNSFEIETESLSQGDKVVIVDDVLATGGTARAASDLIEKLGAQVVEAAFLIEIPALQGREKLSKPVFSLFSIEEE